MARFMYCLQSGVASEGLFPRLLVDNDAMERAKACLRAESERAKNERRTQDELMQLQREAVGQGRPLAQLADPKIGDVVQAFPFIRHAAEDHHEGKNSELLKVGQSFHPREILTRFAMSAHLRCLAGFRGAQACPL